MAARAGTSVLAMGCIDVPALHAQNERVTALPAPGFGAEVRRRRKARGWSQEELAEAAGCSRNTIWRVEKGDATVQVETMQGIAEALLTSVAALFGGDASADAGALNPEEAAILQAYRGGTLGQRAVIFRVSEELRAAQLAAVPLAPAPEPSAGAPPAGTRSARGKGTPARRHRAS
jgi:transcriptional regulator with XRE-family HTH domain